MSEDEDVVGNLLKAVEAALPSIQVETLRKALNELEELRGEKQSLTVQLKAIKLENREYSETVNRSNLKIEDLQKRVATLVVERDDFKGQVRDAEIAALRASLEATHDTTDKFLKNTVYRETLQHQVVNEYPTILNQQGPSGYPYQVQSGTTKQHMPVTDVKEQTSE